MGPGRMAWPLGHHPREGISRLAGFRPEDNGKKVVLYAQDFPLPAPGCPGISGQGQESAWDTAVWLVSRALAKSV